MYTRSLHFVISLDTVHWFYARSLKQAVELLYVSGSLLLNFFGAMRGSVSDLAVHAYGAAEMFIVLDLLEELLWVRF